MGKGTCQNLANELLLLIEQRIGQHSVGLCLSMFHIFVSATDFQKSWDLPLMTWWDIINLPTNQSVYGSATSLELPHKVDQHVLLDCYSLSPSFSTPAHCCIFHDGHSLFLHFPALIVQSSHYTHYALGMDRMLLSSSQANQARWPQRTTGTAPPPVFCSSNRSIQAFKNSP